MRKQLLFYLKCQTDNLPMLNVASVTQLSSKMEKNRTYLVIYFIQAFSNKLQHYNLYYYHLVHEAKLLTALSSLS